MAFFKDEFITYFLQRSILGIESYLVGAVTIELAIRKKPSSIQKKASKPFSLGGRKACDNFYHRLPALIDESYSLKTFNNDLWANTILFYNEVRNPLFHGHNLHSININDLIITYDFLADIYEWIDLWHPPENLISGGSIFSGVKKRVKKSHK